MAIDPAALSLEEYRALRATIRERGNLRFISVLVTFSVWAAVATWISTQVTAPVAVLVPLFVLVVGFEVVYSLHVGTERVGRYLQVYYESVTELPPAWEHLAMAIGADKTAAPLKLDGLFSAMFAAGAILNLIPVAFLTAIDSGGLPVELIAYACFHAFFIVRIVQARRIARGQRARDLAFFEKQRHS